MRILAASLLVLLAACAAPAEEETGDAAGEAYSSASPGAALDAAYSKPENFEAISKKAYGWLGYNQPPCAAFMSFALESYAHVAFPANRLATITPTRFPADATKGIVSAVTPMTSDPFLVRTNTSGLASYLIEQKGFAIVWAPSALVPGDVVFALPDDPADRHPTHAYMFHGWQDKAQGWAWVIDNEADGHCDKTDRTFVAFCKADGSGADLCCAGPGKRMYKRSITKSLAEPNDKDEIDNRMWFALRAPG